MQDLERLVELGREFAEPWKRATKMLAWLLVIAVVALLILACRSKDVVLQADFNNHSEISQTQG